MLIKISRGRLKLSGEEKEVVLVDTPYNPEWTVRARSLDGRWVRNVTHRCGLVRTCGCCADLISRVRAGQKTTPRLETMDRLARC